MSAAEAHNAIELELKAKAAKLLSNLRDGQREAEEQIKREVEREKAEGEEKVKFAEAQAQAAYQHVQQVSAELPPLLVAIGNTGSHSNHAKKAVRVFGVKQSDVEVQQQVVVLTKRMCSILYTNLQCNKTKLINSLTPWAGRRRAASGR